MDGQKEKKPQTSAAKPWETLYDDLAILEKTPLSEEERLLAATEPLLSWYGEHARVLPWREDPTPYHVWISEIMLQQTRVEAVKGYYARFLAALPDISSLACVPEDELLKLWEGLGYYNRARNLKKAAVEAVERYGGTLPASYEELLALPGIGSYTAGAVASIAFGIPVPAVDGNVLRVISRLLESREDILKQSVKRSMEQMLTRLMPRDRAAQYNQALMEIGALVCVPNGAPHCEECPLKGLCLAFRHGSTGEIPVKTPKKPRTLEEKTVLAVEQDGKILIRKRPGRGLLAGLYELPNLEGYKEPEEILSYLGCSEELTVCIEPLPAAKHIFSHVEWHMKGYYIRLKKDVEIRCEGQFYTREEIRAERALPNAFQAYTKPLLEQ